MVDLRKPLHMKSLNLQARAIAILQTVLVDGHSLDEALSQALKKNSKENALLQEWCYGTLRYYDRLIYTLEPLLRKPFKKQDSDIEIALLLGLYQLQETRFPPAVSVAETVNALSHKPWAKGVVNAVLRHFLRQQDNGTSSQNVPESALYSHPQWMIDLWKKAFPEQWKNMCEANNTRPPMTLRINLSRIEKSAYLDVLTQAQIAFQDIPALSSAVILEKAMNVDHLPGFSEGLVSVQDSGAQYLPALLALQPELAILDTCSAPGGKLLHLLETAPASVKVTAVEIEEKRMQKIEENLRRLGYSKRVKLIHADILKPDTWGDKHTLYDRIIADVPCSAMGVIRRHPDIKRLRQPKDIAQFAAIQSKMLNTLWAYLKPNGLLIYITCSTCPQENDQVIKAFVESEKTARSVPIQLGCGLSTLYGTQLLPGLYEGDGFYYAKLQKIV